MEEPALDKDKDYDMRIADRRKINWLGWLFQGIPAGLAVLTVVWVGGGQLGSINTKLQTILENEARTAERLDKHEQLLEQLTIKVQEHDYEIQLLHDTFVQPPKKKTAIHLDAGLPSDYNPRQ